MDVSIIIATYKRSDIFDNTLKSIKNCNKGDFQYEVIVVDNADDLKTKEVCEIYKNDLNLKFLVMEKNGKNAALNFALPHASGKLFIFLDDDVVVYEDWLIELMAGVDRWPDDDVFGGRILPLWPDERRYEDGIEEEFFQSAFVIADWSIPEGKLEAYKVWGPNMAVRKRIFDDGYKFSGFFGPNGADSYVMGSETEFTKRLEKDGYRSIYLPKAVVNHQIRDEQMKISWLYGRAFKRGRSEVFYEERPKVKYMFGVPRYLFKTLVTLFIKRMTCFLTNKKIQMINTSISYFKVKGKFHQFWLERKGQEAY